MNIQNSVKEFMIWFIKKKITTPPFSGVFCLYEKVYYLCWVKQINEGRIIGFNRGVF